MKRPKVIIAIIVAFVIGTFLFVGPIKRIRQEHASMAMMQLKGDLLKHVHENEAWPRSWDDLYPPGMEYRKRESSRMALVNWEITIEEMVQYIQQWDPTKRIRDSEVPFVVRYTDRVPRDWSLNLSEKVWSDLIAEEVYRAWMARGQDEE